MDHTLNEDDILDQLNRTDTVIELLHAATTCLSQQIEHLILNQFTKEHHATQFVIPSLLGEEGPLNQISIQLKLLFVLGGLSKSTYEKIERLFEVTEILTNHHPDIEFNDPVLIEYMDFLLPPTAFIETNNDTKTALNMVSHMQYSMDKHRQSQRIRAILLLALSTLMMQIAH